MNYEPEDPDVIALQALCRRVGGHQALAAVIDMNDQSIYQIITGVKLKSGNRKGVGPTLRKRLNETYPGWQAEGLQTETNQPASSVEETLPIRTGKRVPIVGTVKGGTDGYLEEFQYPVGHGDGYVEYWTPDASAYALRVVGDSMHPRYRAGEYIVVTPSIEAQPGKDVVVKLRDGCKLLKELAWIHDMEVKLLSINNGVPAMTIDRSEIESIHRVGGRVDGDALIRNA